MIAKQIVLAYAARKVSFMPIVILLAHILAARTAGLAMSGFAQYPNAQESVGGLTQYSCLYVQGSVMFRKSTIASVIVVQVSFVGSRPKHAGLVGNSVQSRSAILKSKRLQKRASKSEVTEKSGSVRRSPWFCILAVGHLGVSVLSEGPCSNRKDTVIGPRRPLVSHFRFRRISFEGPLRSLRPSCTGWLTLPFAHAEPHADQSLITSH
jgi:hypothetical protein